MSGYGPIMPSYRERLTEEQINALIAYIKSIGPGVRAVDRRPSGQPAVTGTAGRAGAVAAVIGFVV